MTTRTRPPSPVPQPAAPSSPTAPPAASSSPPARHHPRPRAHIGWIVAASLVTGLLAALLFVAAPFIPAEESEVTGAVLCGFALGWAMLAVLSVRLTDQPQRCAAALALFMVLGGVLLVVFGSGADEALKWVWPPALLALVIWM